MEKISEPDAVDAILAESASRQKSMQSKHSKGAAKLKEQLEEANAKIAKLTKFHETVLGSAFEFTK